MERKVKLAAGAAALSIAAVGTAVGARAATGRSAESATRATLGGDVPGAEARFDKIGGRCYDIDFRAMQFGDPGSRVIAEQTADGVRIQIWDSTGVSNFLSRGASLGKAVAFFNKIRPTRATFVLQLSDRKLLLLFSSTSTGTDTTFKDEPLG